MVTSLVACGGSNNTEDEQPVQEEAKPENKYAYVIENDVVKIEIDDPVDVEDISVPVFQSAITNLTDDEIIVKGFPLQPGETSEQPMFFYENYEEVGYCTLDAYVTDSQGTGISTILVNVAVDDEGKINKFDITTNEAVSTGLAKAIKIEQIGDASLVGDGKESCGDTYHSEALLKVTNTSDITIILRDSYCQGIVLKPGESTEINGEDRNSACDATLELPFSASIQFYEYKDSDNIDDYMDDMPIQISFDITH